MNGIKPDMPINRLSKKSMNIGFEPVFVDDFFDGLFNDCNRRDENRLRSQIQDFFSNKIKSDIEALLLNDDAILLTDLSNDNVDWFFEIKGVDFDKSKVLLHHLSSAK